MEIINAKLKEKEFIFLRYGKGEEILTRGYVSPSLHPSPTLRTLPLK
jgi:hypothetical protein